MHRLGCLVLVVGCSATPHVPTTPASPITLTMSADRELLVPVSIDGTAFTFQLDTGANETTITPATWKQLGLAHGTREEAAGAGGMMASGETVTVHSVRVGDREVTELPIGVAELAEVTSGQATPIAGVLGQDVLGRFIADIDPAHQRLLLHATDATAWRTADLAALPYELTPDGLIRIAVTLDGQPVAAIVDLGAGATIANSHAAPASTPQGDANALGADGHPLAMATVAGKHLGLGGLDLAIPTLYVSDLPVFEVLRLAAQPALILGMDLLATHRIVIDPGARRLYLSR